MKLKRTSHELEVNIGPGLSRVTVPKGTICEMVQGGYGREFWRVRSDGSSFIPEDEPIARHDAKHYGIWILEADLEDLP